MDVVIKLSDEDYEFIKDLQGFMVLGRGGYKTVQQNVINAIKNGTPLPKGHGRLIENNEELYQSIRNWCSPDKAYEIITKAKTIVEADKG